MRLFRFTNLLAFCKAHTEKAEGDRSANIAYITHTGKHRDKGVLHFSVQEGNWPESGGYEKNQCDEAVRMILDGSTVPEVLSLFGGSMLWAVNNLSKLQRLKEESDYEKEYRKIMCIKWKMTEVNEDNEDVPF